MSGPCTDCGGPDYQTLMARIAELEACANTSICIFCGTTMEKDWAVILDHAKGCELRPENRLMLQIAKLEAENERLRDLICRCMKVGCQWCGLSAVSFDVEQRVMRQAERGAK